MALVLAVKLSLSTRYRVSLNVHQLDLGFWVNIAIMISVILTTAVGPFLMYLYFDSNAEKVEEEQNQVDHVHYQDPII